jgi:hypothetical protein
LVETHAAKGRMKARIAMDEVSFILLVGFTAVLARDLVRD